MRLHHLRVTAFQAFAGTEQVDFDALSAAGLFLLRGDTGAGKTTLLDSVCFALYGEVPGARAKDARLRSDHAPPELRTEVELDVTLRERRFRIVRRPKQERPKVRGEGLTEEGHGCTVQELRDGEWVTIAARPDEARAELADPLGMSCEQFCQVVLLPQGEFAAFLRAGSDERWRLLERLFGTERFTAVEAWLRLRAREAWRELNGQLGTVRDVVARLAQASGDEPPADWELDPDRLREWAGGLSVGAQAGAVTAEESAASARAARAAAESALAAATELAERQERHARALRELESWRARQQVRDDAERELRAARAAAPVAPALATARARAEEAAAADRTAATAWEALDDAARAVADAADATPPAGARAERADADAPPAGAEAEPAPAPAPVARSPPPAEPEPEPAPELTLFDLPPEISVTPTTATVVQAPEVAAEAEAAAADDAAAAALRLHAGELRTRAGALGELVAVERRLDASEQALTALLADAEAADARADAAARALEEAAGERVRLDELLATARRAADRVEVLEAEARTAAARAEQALERDRRAAEQERLDALVRDAVGVEQAARERWLDLRERRLAGMATELAAGLIPGEPCSVCGATDHPAPAHLAAASAGEAAAATGEGAAGEAAAASEAAAGEAAATGEGAASEAAAASAGGFDTAAVGGASLADQERAAQEQQAEAGERRAAAERAAAANASALAAARAIAGEASAEELRAEAAQRAELLAQTRQQAGGLAAAERKLAALATTTATHEQQRREAEQAAATARAAHNERAAALTSEREQVAAARGEADSIAARVAQLTEQAAAADAAAAARERQTLAATARDQAATAVARAVDAAGFETVAAAAQAIRDDAALQQLERKLRDYDEGVASRAALVADETLKAAAAQPAPDLPELRAAAERAARDDESCQGRNTVEQRRLAEVTSLSGALDSALTQLAPVAARERLIRELAGLVDGGSTANRLKMRLSAYVLAARLEEVAEAATQRLERMSNGRYALIHADDGARGRKRGGLDLKIVDGWTGQERSPATLSGGETFLASLALALGLADVVAADAGGSRLETLFIDEGFGSLDERTLDEVLDVLDQLREGGRAVGIVSHVAELRQRVPAQLLVVKGRDGSHVEQAAATPAG